MSHPYPLTNEYIQQTIAQLKPRASLYMQSGESGLGLYISAAGSAAWRLHHAFNKKPTTTTLGRWPEIPTEHAYQQAIAAKEMIGKKIDPRLHLDAIRSACSPKTLQAVAREWYAANLAAKTWSQKHADNIIRHLERHVFPDLGPVAMADIESSTVAGTVRNAQHATTTGVARRVKQILGQVFRYANSNGYCNNNPIPNLTHVLPPAKTQHRTAIIDVESAQQLMAGIQQYQGHEVGTANLQLAPLVFLRPIELRSLEWRYIDWDKARLVIPGSEMKGRSDHVVPLSRQALDILSRLNVDHGHRQYVFRNQQDYSKHISSMAIRHALNSMGFMGDRMTCHGFRAMARTLLDEELGYRPEIIEMQLAHKVFDANGRAYNRTQFIDQRTAMMQAWADYLDVLAREGIPSKTDKLSGR